jgi:hypothetical protein
MRLARRLARWLRSTTSSPFAPTDHWASDYCALHERCPGEAALSG